LKKLQKDLPHLHKKKWGRNTNLKRKKKKLKRTMGTHNKEAMKSTKRGSKKKHLRKRHQKTSQAHNKDATKLITSTQQ
jgi:hypothetical protein